MSNQTNLHAEHELLGAAFTINPQTNSLIPDSYIAETSFSAEKNSDACCLFDLSGSAYQLVSGADAPAFIDAAFAGPYLEAGDLSFQPAFAGDGSVVSVALVARSGDHEFFYIDISQRGAALSKWLEFITRIKTQDATPYGSVALEDANSLLVPLMLAGPGAHAVLSDYLKHTDQVLPEQGKIASLLLDTRIAALVGHLALEKLDAFIVLVSPTQARLIWRSFLSFDNVEVHGRQQLTKVCLDTLPWFRLLDGSDKIVVPQDILDVHGFIRKSRDFIGGRALQ